MERKQLGPHRRDGEGLGSKDANKQASNFLPQTPQRCPASPQERLGAAFSALPRGAEAARGARRRAGRRIQAAQAPASEHPHRPAMPTKHCASLAAQDRVGNSASKTASGRSRGSSKHFVSALTSSITGDRAMAIRARRRGSHDGRQAKNLQRRSRGVALGPPSIDRTQALGCLEVVAKEP